MRENAGFFGGDGALRKEYVHTGFMQTGGLDGSGSNTNGRGNNK